MENPIPPRRITGCPTVTADIALTVIDVAPRHLFLNGSIPTGVFWRDERSYPQLLSASDLSRGCPCCLASRLAPLEVSHDDIS